MLRNDPTDERSDVYSFAVILWELITLQYPWEELGSPVQIVVQVAFLHRRLTLPTWLPQEATTLVQDCWAREPSQRPSFPEILEALKAELPEAWADRQVKKSPPPHIVSASSAVTPAERAERAVVGMVNTHKTAAAAALAEKKAAMAADTPTPSGAASTAAGASTPTTPAGPSTPGAPLSPADFVTLKGLKPIKTPAPVVKRDVGRPSLGPTHMSTEESEEGTSSEEDGEGAPGLQGYSIAKRLGGGGGGGDGSQTPACGARGGGGEGTYSCGGGDGGGGGSCGGEGFFRADKPVSPGMAAAEALRPKLTALETGVKPVG